MEYVWLKHNIVHFSKNKRLQIYFVYAKNEITIQMNEWIHQSNLSILFMLCASNCFCHIEHQKQLCTKILVYYTYTIM